MHIVGSILEPAVSAVITPFPVFNLHFCFFFFFSTRHFQDVQSERLDDVSDLNSSPFQVAGMFGRSKKPNLDFTLGRI